MTHYPKGEKPVTKTIWKLSASGYIFDDYVAQFSPGTCLAQLCQVRFMQLGSPGTEATSWLVSLASRCILKMLICISNIY